MFILYYCAQPINNAFTALKDNSIQLKRYYQLTWDGVGLWWRFSKEDTMEKRKKRRQTLQPLEPTHLIFAWKLSCKLWHTCQHALSRYLPCACTQKPLNAPRIHPSAPSSPWEMRRSGGSDLWCMKHHDTTTSKRSSSSSMSCTHSQSPHPRLGHKSKQATEPVPFREGCGFMGRWCLSKALFHTQSLCLSSL